MKKILYSLMAVAALATVFTSCSKEETDGAAAGNEVVMGIVVDSELDIDRSRTYITDGSNYANWSETGEALEVIEYTGPGSVKHATTASDYTLQDGVAAFRVSFPAVTDVADFTYTAVYPAAHYESSDNTDLEAFKLVLPNKQTPAESSFDPDADLMIAKTIGRQSQPAEGESLNFRFRRIAALGRMTVKGIPAGETINTVRLSITSKDDDKLVGRVKANLLTGEVILPAYYNGGTLELTITRTAGADNVIWFTALPVNLGEGESLKIEVDTDKATYAKEATFTAAKPFTLRSSGVTSFTFNLTNHRTEKVTDQYDLLTDASKLSAGDKIIIAAMGYDCAMSTTQNDNNRGQVAVTIEDGNKITAIPESVQILTIEPGAVDNTFALYTGSGYLYAAGSGSNYLRTQDAIDANASWTVEIAADGVATIKAQGSNTNNWMRYNSTSDIFSCYGSGQKDIHIFHKEGIPTPVLAAPTDVTAALKEGTANTVTVTWSDVADESGYTVTWTDTATGEAKTRITAADVTSVDIENLAYETEYAFSVKANGDAVNYKDSAATAAAATVTTGASPEYTFVKVEAAPSDWSGTYLITYTDGTAVYVLSGVTNKYGSYETYSEKLQPDGSIVAGKTHACTIEKSTDGYSIRMLTGYLGWDSSTALCVADAIVDEAGTLNTAYKWTLDWTSTAVIAAANDSDRKLKFNISTNPMRFACYTSGNKALTLYRMQE